MKTKVKDGIIHVERQSLNKKMRLVWTIASLLLIFAGALGLVFIQGPVSEPQIVQKQASVNQGQVIVTGTRESDFKIGETEKIYLSINTHGIQLDGVELTFSVITEAIDQLKVRVLPTTNLQTARLEIDETSNGFLVNMASYTPSGAKFSSTQDLKIVELEFKPTKSGAITLNFDAAKSFAPVSNSNPVKDELKHIASMDFIVLGQIITTNNNDINDTGLNRGCNQYCADKSECASIFICQENRCRLPENPDDSTCRLPISTTILTSNQQLCNQTCETNNDCAINLGCYDGLCRLKSNPSSTSCSTTRKRIVYKTIYQSADTTTNLTKGGDLSKQATDSSEIAKTKEATTAAQIEPEIEIPYQAALTEKPAIVEVPADETALQAIMSRLQDRGISLSVLMIGAGAILGIIVLLSLLSGRRRTSQPSKQIIKQPMSSQDQQQIGNLQQKIQTLQSQQPTSPIPANAAGGPPPSAMTPPLARPMPQPQPYQAPVAIPVSPHPVPTLQPFQPQVNQPSISQDYTGLSLAERTKQKGLIKPAGSQTKIFEKDNS